MNASWGWRCLSWVGKLEAAKQERPEEGALDAAGEGSSPAKGDDGESRGVGGGWQWGAWLRAAL